MECSQAVAFDTRRDKWIRKLRGSSLRGTILWNQEVHVWKNSTADSSWLLQEITNWVSSIQRETRLLSPVEKSGSGVNNHFNQRTEKNPNCGKNFGWAVGGVFFVHELGYNPWVHSESRRENYEEETFIKSEIVHPCIELFVSATCDGRDASFGWNVAS